MRKTGKPPRPLKSLCRGHGTQAIQDFRAQLDLSLRDGQLAAYDALAAWLRNRGYEIVEASAPFSGGGLKQKLDLVRQVTEQATAVIDASPDADNNLSAALLRLVQQHLFEMLTHLKAHRLTQKDIAKIATSVAQMTRATVMHQKWASELKSRLAERVGAAEREVVAEARRAASTGGGLSQEAETRIRTILMEITE